MTDEKAKGGSNKSNYNDFMSALERDFYNNDLNKIVAPSDLGFTEPVAFYDRDNFLESPIPKPKILGGRDSYPQSPFKQIKSPNYMLNKPVEPDYASLESEYKELGGHFKNFFDKEDNSLTVGQMFCVNDFGGPVKKEKKDEAESFHRAVFTEDCFYTRKGKKIKNEGNSRCLRGLKVLSVKVRNIVFQKKQTSYKEVADALISESNFGENVSSALNKKNKNKKKARDEQNVKRRVYDALNVLIAAEVLRKVNKVVYYNETEKGAGRNFKQEKTALTEQLQQREFSLMRKKLELQTLVQKFIAVISLINRNKEQRKKAHVKFPFLLIAPAPGNDTEVTLEMQPNYKKLLMQSNKEITLNGDLEVLILLNMHLFLGKSNFYQIIGKHFKESKDELLGQIDPDYVHIMTRGLGEKEK